MNRKVIINLAASLDMYIEGPNGEYDWCFVDQDYGMTAFLDRIDAILFGRKSYELLYSTEKNPYPGKQKYVISRNIIPIHPGGVLLNGNIAGEVNQLKQLEGKDIWLFGGAEMVTYFLNEGLADELQIAVHPLLLGQGKPLFHDIQKHPLQLVDTVTYDSGLVILKYLT